MTQLEVKVLFNKYNFHKPFSKQLLTKLYKEQAHSLAGRGAKITWGSHSVRGPKFFVLTYCSFPVGNAPNLPKIRVNIF